MDSPGSMNLPLEDLDFDLPPGAGAARPRFYDSEFGGPQPRFSYADSLDTPSIARPSENPSFAALHNTDPHNSSYGHSAIYQQYRDNPSQVAMGPLGHDRSSSSGVAIMAEKQATYGRPGKGRRRWLMLGGIALLILIIGAVIGVYFGVVRPSQKHPEATSSSPSSSGSGSGNPSSAGPDSGGTKNLAAVTGGDGSKITTDDGSSFLYSNKFGGYWWSDPNDPFANNAQSQSWNPPLNQTFQWGQNKIYGFVHPFMVGCLGIKLLAVE